MMQKVPFFDLQIQYINLKNEIDEAVLNVMKSGHFIGGNEVQQFENNFAKYLGMQHVVACGNGTDALFLALMSANLPKNTSIIIPTFNYIAAAEVATLLGYQIVFADVCTDTFNTSLKYIKKVYNSNVRAIIVTHLFGQLVEDIEEINQFCIENNILLIEDAAQCIGAEKNIDRKSIITTSFFPTKNLACYGDGGAVIGNDIEIMNNIRKLANHGQKQKYYHESIGINSRLDALQASILNIKLQYLDNFLEKKKYISSIYDEALKNIQEIEIPIQKTHHTFHQYTMKVDKNCRNDLKKYLKEKNIETAIYYPMCIHQQEAYKQDITLPNAEQLCEQVLSLPIFPELKEEQIQYVCHTIKSYFL